MVWQERCRAAKTLRHNVLAEARMSACVTCVRFRTVALKVSAAALGRLSATTPSWGCLNAVQTLPGRRCGTAWTALLEADVYSLGNESFRTVFPAMAECFYGIFGLSFWYRPTVFPPYREYKLLPTGLPYSPLSTSTGFALAARRAGIHTPTAIMTSISR